MTASPIRALEFYSGIGAFAQAAQCFGSVRPIEVVAAFDQSQWANQVYYHNYAQQPVSRNLDSISLNHIPDADLWWMSPPCTPYSRRGAQKDIEDPRAKSFLRLLEFAAVKQPTVILLENVEGFLDSKMYQHYCQTMMGAGYTLNTTKLCPTMFGVPMLRPRIYVTASKKALQLPQISAVERQALSSFVDSTLGDTDGSALLLPSADVEKYEAVLNILDIADIENYDKYAICFTSGYYRCRKASGTLLRLANGRVRFFSPVEILRLLGFVPQFDLKDLNLPICYRLVGNSVDVRAIKYLLNSVKDVLE